MKNFKSLSDTEKDLKNIIDRTVSMSIPEVASEFLKDSNLYVPFDTGDLAKSGIKSSVFRKGLIVWQTPYARRLFYNPQYNFSKDANPNARGLWAEYAKEQNKDKYLGITTDQFEKAKKLK